MSRLWMAAVLAAGLGTAVPAAAQEVDFADQSSVTDRIDRMIAECRKADKTFCVQVCESSRKLIVWEFYKGAAEIRTLRYEYAPCLHEHQAAIADTARPAR